MMKLDSNGLVGERQQQMVPAIPVWIRWDTVTGCVANTRGHHAVDGVGAIGIPKSVAQPITTIDCGIPYSERPDKHCQGLLRPSEGAQQDNLLDRQDMLRWHTWVYAVYSLDRDGMMG
jgi:hypothetical protein